MGAYCASEILHGGGVLLGGAVGRTAVEVVRGIVGIQRDSLREVCNSSLRPASVSCKEKRANRVVLGLQVGMPPIIKGEVVLGVASDLLRIPLDGAHLVAQKTKHKPPGLGFFGRMH